MFIQQCKNNAKTTLLSAHLAFTFYYGDFAFQKSGVPSDFQNEKKF